MIYYLNLSTQGMDIMSISETYSLCLMMTKYVFMSLKEFIDMRIIPENKQTDWCRQIVNRNIDILSKTSPNIATYNNEPVLLKVHSVSCVIINQEQDLACLRLKLNLPDAMRVGPITLIKLMAEINHAALISLNKRLPHNDKLRQTNSEIQYSVEIITDHLCKGISMIPDNTEYPANVHTNFSTIILEVEREFVVEKLNKQ